MATSEQLESLIDELNLVLSRSHMTEESYDYLYNVKTKLEDIAYNQGENLGNMTSLCDLEKY